MGVLRPPLTYAFYAAFSASPQDIRPQRNFRSGL